MALPVDFRLKIYGTDRNDTPEVMSNWVTLSTDTLSTSTDGYVQFSHQQYHRILESDTTTRVGTFTIPDGTELKHVMMDLFIMGAGFDPPDENWIGTIFLDYDGYPLRANVLYYMAVETLGYTRDADLFYIGVNLDWSSPVNSPILAGRVGARIRILGKR